MVKLDLNEIYSNRNISNTSKKMYINNIIRLNNGKNPSNLRFLNDVEDIKKQLSKYKDNTQRNYIISIVSLLSAIPKKNKVESKLFDDYSKIMDEMNQKLKTSNIKTDKEKKNWMTQNEVKIKHNQLMDIIGKIKNKKVLNISDYNELLDLVILSLYVYLPPRRIKDYSDMVIILNGKTPEDIHSNYICTKSKRFIFNEYKTKDTYGQQIIHIPDDLINVLNIYLKYLKPYNKQYLLQKYNDTTKPTEKFIQDRLNDIFQKKISASMLRKIYLTSKYKDLIKEMEDDAVKMGTSAETIKNNYVKMD